MFCVLGAAVYRVYYGRFERRGQNCSQTSYEGATVHRTPAHGRVPAGGIVAPTRSAWQPRVGRERGVVWIGPRVLVEVSYAENAAGEAARSGAQRRSGISTSVRAQPRSALTLGRYTAYRPSMYVAASDGLPARRVGVWSKEKLTVVGNYMGIFTSSMKRKWTGLTYVDLFAGPGMCVVEDAGEELRGSPLLALDTKQSFDAIICVEQDEEAREALKQRVERHPRGATVKVLAGDCNAIIGQVIARMPQGYLSLVFIDPEGVSGLNAETMRALADRRLFVDVIILFPQQMSVNRNRWQWRGAPADTPLDRAVGTDWRTKMTPEVVQFMDLLRDFGFTFVAGAGRAFKNKIGAQLYYLVFASKSITAVQFWEKISRDDEQPPLF